MIKAAFLMVVYAVAMVAIGTVAFMLAPSGAKAATALIIPAACAGLMLVCAGLTAKGFMSTKAGKGTGKPGMMGIHLGLLLPLLFCLAFAGRAWPATNAFLDAKSTLASGSRAENLAAAVIDQAATDGQSLDALSKDYLIAALWSLSGLSLFAFAALVSHRPKMTKPASPAA
jgi:hypothetical protein